MQRAGAQICQNVWMIKDITGVATAILEGFAGYRRTFREVTNGAQDRFERADWTAVQAASSERIGLYRTHTDRIAAQIQTTDNIHVWSEIRSAYTALISTHRDGDLAETVFNTIYRKMDPMTGSMSDQFAFVNTPGWQVPATAKLPVTGFGPSPNIGLLLREVLTSRGFNVPWQNLDRDIELMLSVMKSSIPLLRNPQHIRLEILDPVFFRNKGAYVIGRMEIGEHQFPVAIPIQHAGDSLYVDTILWNEDDLSVIFSFTRSYFMVDVECPARMIAFLAELLPQKRIWELYTSLGFFKHGKTLFYHGLTDHLQTAPDEFRVAEGIKGLVMCVFTLPSYQVVFKVIRERFPSSKRVTPEQVKQAYYLVKTHDRVGRMADTQEFINLRFPRSRFSDAVLEELISTCGASVDVAEDEVTIAHLYTERLMTPLNLYVQRASEFELEQVLEDYGRAIKQLAAANIFPGDMLMKNFGVTRHRRVVFYDYDEICYLTDVNFREIPLAAGDQEMMAAEPWYEVDPWDVFPEEFGRFLFPSEHMKLLFCEHHEDLFSVGFWQELQQRIRGNEVLDVYPYGQKRSFRRNLGDSQQTE